MKGKIIFFLAAIFLTSLFFTGFARSEQQEEFSLNSFSRAYGTTFGNLDYNAFFDFNRNNSIDNEDLKVCISNTPLKSLTPFLSVSKKSSRRKKSSKDSKVSHSTEEGEDPLDIDKDGDVDEQDVNLMKNLLTSTQMINTFSNFNALNMALTIKPHNNAPTLASFYAFIGYSPEVSYNVDFLSLTLEAAAQIDNDEQDQSKATIKDLLPEDTDQLKTTTASNLLFLNMQVLKDVIKLCNLGPDKPAPSAIIPPTETPGTTEAANTQQINDQTSEKQQLMSDKQQRKRTLQHLSTNTPVLIDQNSRNNHYDKSTENKELEILKQ